MIVKEELDGTDIDDIGNLEDLIRIVSVYPLTLCLLDFSRPLL